jgi:putative ABC transport system permease protein
MFKNYFSIAWRNLLRNKTNSLINIGGLAVGLACVIFITLYVQDEMHYDKGFKMSDRIYQVTLSGNFGGQEFNTSNTPPPVGIDMHATFPEVEDYTRIYRMGNTAVRNAAPALANHPFTEKNLWAVDSNFLQVFDYPMLEGDPAGCLKKYHSIVITETMARKYFGKTSAIGGSLKLDTYEAPFVVTGVLKDLPSNASLQFDMLMPVQDCSVVQRFSWSWVWCQMTAYIVLTPQAAKDPSVVKKLQAKFPAMVRKDAAQAFARIGQPFDQFIKKGGKWDFHLQRLTDMHLYSAELSTPLTNLGNIKYIYIFSAIAVFIVLLACINFMNLSTAQAVRRAKEVGIRKVLGSLKGQLIRQFLSEAMLYTGIATLIALFLVYALMTPFNMVAAKSLTFTSIFQHGIWLFILLLLILTGLLAGSYPAFYLTSFQPVAVLKGSGLFAKSLGAQLVRNGLVVFQFTISITLIICTLVVFRQLKYVRNMDLGFKKDNVLVLPNLEKLTPDYSAALTGREETLRQQMARIPGVTNASLTTGILADDYAGFTDFYVPVATGVKEPLAKDLTLTSFMTDEHLAPALQLQIIQGRNFSKNFSDSDAVIVNETTVRTVGWKDPIGKRLTYPGGGNQTFHVIGVVKDFNLRSARTTIEPFALFYSASRTNHLYSNYLIASTDAAHTPDVLRRMEKIWKDFAPDVPFEYSFLDKNYEALYRSEQRMGNVFSIFTTLSILVACLGLFGLSVYTAERRIREIGIRKILGASVQNLVRLLSRDFLKLVLLSTIIAFPLGWWAMHKWLEDFPYRISIGVDIFLLAGLLATGIALYTVSFQAIRAATMNPSKSLKAE